MVPAMIDLDELRARAEASKLKTVDAYGMVQLTGAELLELLTLVNDLGELAHERLTQAVAVIRARN